MFTQFCITSETMHLLVGEIASAGSDIIYNNQNHRKTNHDKRSHPCPSYIKMSIYRHHFFIESLVIERGFIEKSSKYYKEKQRKMNLGTSGCVAIREGPLKLGFTVWKAIELKTLSKTNTCYV